jgi:glycosyltransferase involved in cell wall biosynthesis
MKHLPTEYKLVLAGPTVTSGEVDPGMRSEQISLLQSHIDQAGLGSRIKVIPEFVDTAEFLAGADVFCFPAENEAMGTPLIEALSSGTPVIANANEPSFTEWIINGENGFLAPLIPEQWASNIQTAACYSEGRRTRITRSIKDRISTETIDEYYVRLMTALVESKPGDRIQVAEVLNR